jgi:tRNA (guanine37-N1)-methyltransferase
MKISILSIFPSLFNDFLSQSILKKMINDQKISIEIVDFRNFSKDKRKKVDDYQYGGGPGMVIQLQPVLDALEQIRTKDSKVILLSPQGDQYSQRMAKKLANIQHIILIAGRYEGFDERLVNYVDQIISIGDYILMGGEIPAMAIVESIARLVDNGINKLSLSSESFDNNLLDYPIYTKPKSIDNYHVPEILFSGNHEKINKYRYNQQLLKTKRRRPDLYNKFIKGDNYGKTK